MRRRSRNISSRRSRGRRSPRSSRVSRGRGSRGIRSRGSRGIRSRGSRGRRPSSGASIAQQPQQPQQQSTQPKDAMCIGNFCIDKKTMDAITSSNTNMQSRDCVWGNWSNWSECDKPCGSGKKLRKRQIKTQRFMAGNPCDGDSEESQECNTQSCKQDCVVSKWGDWNNCDKKCGGGSQVRTRTVDTPSLHGGQPCPELVDTEECNTAPCPVDCDVSEWSAWGDCDANCGGGEKRRTRSIKTNMAYGGKPCPVLSESEECNTQECAIDCQVSDWGPWSSCDKECGSGKQKRNRSIVKNAKHGGKACPALVQEQDCNTQPCPVDCDVSGWNAWGECTKSCGGGKKTRTRSIVTNVNHGGKPCPVLSESDNCNTQPCPEECEMSPWGEWTTCDKTCGSGKQTRTRKVIKQSAHGASPCPTTLSEERACNTEACPENCEVSQWSSWSSCDKPCGTGKQSRSRSVTKQSAHGGTACPTNLTETRDCNTQECRVNCEVSPWSNWSQCDKKCGGGKQSRTRTVTKQPLGSGSKCPVLREERACNTERCIVSNVKAEIVVPTKSVDSSATITHNPYTKPHYFKKVTSLDSKSKQPYYIRFIGIPVDRNTTRYFKLINENSNSETGNGGYEQSGIINGKPYVVNYLGLAYQFGLKPSGNQYFVITNPGRWNSFKMGPFVVS